MKSRAIPILPNLPSALDVFHEIGHRVVGAAQLLNPENLALSSQLVEDIVIESDGFSGAGAFDVLEEIGC